MSRNPTDRCRRAPASPGGFTLIEVLIAVTLMLMMMVLVASIFALMSGAIEGARAMVETSDRLRACRNKLQSDLAGIEGPLRPPHRPEEGRPYVEIIEGPTGPCVPTEFGGSDPALVAAALANGQAVLDTTLGDMDDILMFVTRSRGTPFVGKFLNDVGGGQPPREITIQSQVAEVAWFLRGTTLYRRQLLVVPGIKPTFNNSVGNGLTIVNPWSRMSSGQTVAPFYKSNDLSVRQIYGPYLQQRDPKSVGSAMLVANTLGDLTNRQNRFAHQPYAYPYDVRFWGRLGLPTLSECSGDAIAGQAAKVLPFPYQQSTNQTWLVERPSPLSQPEIYPLLCPPGLVDGKQLIVTAGPRPFRKINMDAVGSMVSWAGGFDAWSRPQPWGVVDSTPSPPELYSPTNHYTGAIDDFASATRVSEDVILTNVLGFDVKVWDEHAPVLMDTNDPRRVLEPGDSGYLALFASGNYQIVQFGAYVDLNYMCLLDQNGDGVIDYLANLPDPRRRPQFADAGDPRSHLVGTAPFRKDFSDPESWPAFNALQPAVYDTWSTFYEHDGIDQDQDGRIDEGANGFDDVPISPGQVDDASELEAPPPYAAPLRGIQVKIRVFEPDTQQIREVTVRQDFVPE